MAFCNFSVTVQRFSTELSLADKRRTCNLRVLASIRAHYTSFFSLFFFSFYLQCESDVGLISAFFIISFSFIFVVCWFD